MSDLDRLPVIIGAGQAMRAVPADLDTAFGAADLAGEALARAFADAGVDSRDVDIAFAVRTFGDSGPAFPNPFGGPDNLGAAAFARAGGQAARHVYSQVGGQQPQTLVAEAARLLMDGTVETACVLGAETIANVKAASRAGAAPDWNEATGVALEDRGPFDAGDFPVSPQAIAARIAAPVYYYALMESARRHALGDSEGDYRDRMAALWEHFAGIAAANPFAVQRSGLSGEAIVTPGPGNPLISTPYTKAMVARDGVNQGAAVLLSTYGRAKEMGVRDVTFLHAHDQAAEPHPLLREHLHRAPAQARVLEGIADHADMLDLYSCFPVVPLEAMRILGLEIGERPLTLTGGLPFFGGPGNNYALHAIAEAHSRVRGTHQTAAVYANGGLASKHACGLYGGKPPARVELRRSPDTPAARKAYAGDNPSGTVVAATVEHRRGAPTGVLVMAETDAGERFYARGGTELGDDIIGDGIATETRGGMHSITPA